jgi:hypothetical protein
LIRTPSSPFRSVGQTQLLGKADPEEDPGALQDTRTWPASRRTRDDRVPGAIASYGVATTRAAKERAAMVVEENIFETGCVERGE